MIQIEEIREQIAACEDEVEVAKRNVDRASGALAVLRHFERIAENRMAEEAAAKLKTESVATECLELGGES